DTRNAHRNAGRRRRLARRKRLAPVGPGSDGVPSARRV
ncbi:MAG: hypothetical protein, partial [Olavius algarvensis Gamma 1 endosymbiont]